ncbi:helix-turn-helix domain-containing protein [Flavilitoribacter nigricans]|uniref:XRE family transcriptional regulator n=1 Tax=Flavilitoribacter nigricans (strain ATCC 23147 / DSM 23189 / NBRC 102662 / NCIMB 1420 / SS-2) TaxID=1122177 RepID=A0A2D0N7Y4_FLAN2|nr:XRE family transcriptional regulator [Flavilitoribacter nigricans]PHN04587.1 XRE family transcriptional regulator [Flavilitoribacter nigricans DSM 23189 = NBRC 102662]
MSNSEYLTIQIGLKIRNIRKNNGLKLGELADRSGISIAMLSKIENGRVFPTLPTLIQILNTLQADLNSFFSDLSTDETFSGYIFRKRADYQPVSKEEESVGFHYEFALSHTVEKSSVEVSLLKLTPNAQRNKVSTAGFEYIYILQGQVRYELGQEVFEMETGDSLFFDGNLPHVPQNAGKTEAMLLVVYFITL